MKEKRKLPLPVMIILGILGGAAAIVGFALLFGFGVVWLWNALMPPIFNLGTITFWQAVGLIVLIRVLFSPFHFNHKHKKGGKHRDWGCGDDDGGRGDWNFKGGWKQWHHYNDYWKEEGKAHFEEYLARKKPAVSEEINTPDQGLS